MARIVERTLAVLLMLAAGLGHSAGSIKTFHGQPVVLLWALSGSALGVLVGALNLLRSYRGWDRALAWLTCGAKLAWLAISVAFGLLIHRPFDPRVLVFVVITGALTLFAARAALLDRS